MIDTNIDHKTIQDTIDNCIALYGKSKQNKRGLVTLIIRYYINVNNINKILEYLYMDGLMKRDYMTILNYIINCYGTHYDVIRYIYSKIDVILPKDVDRIIDNKWFDLLKQFDGYPVATSYEPNDNGATCTTYDEFHSKHITSMRDIYAKRIEGKDGNKDVTECMKDVDIIIDGANMSHLSGQFNPAELISIINMLEKKKYTVKVIFHSTRKITIPILSSYIIYTPKYRNDDDYLLYGMLTYGKMVLSNDMFRDHVKNMNIYTKCYVENKTIRYINKKLIIPKYNKCIQFKPCGAFIPSIKGGFYFLPSISPSTAPPSI